MGVNISSLIHAKEVELSDLAGKVIGIDGHNVAYQFLATIRRKPTGELLTDKMGRVTSHLMGILHRTSNMIEAGIKPLFVWDGKPPIFKKNTIQARRAVREEAVKKWVKALERGEEAMKYAQAALSFTPTMVEESIKLLDYMGIPSIRARSEGEAQLAMMAKKGEIWASASQDWDSLLFNSPRLVRNLSITGRRKLPKKPIYIEIKPEVIELDKVLKTLEITSEQLIVIGILVGTDYNPGVKGIGPKSALRIVKKQKTFDKVLEQTNLEHRVEMKNIFNFFVNPPVEETYEIKWKKPNTDKLIELMVEEHNFSQKRVEKVVKTLQEGFSIAEKRRSLEAFLT